jgi:hypothetical protein
VKAAYCAAFFKSVLIVNLLRRGSFLFGRSTGFHPLNLQETSLSLPQPHTTFISSHNGVILVAISPFHHTNVGPEAFTTN